MKNNLPSSLFMRREISGGHKQAIHSLTKEMLNLPDSKGNTRVHIAALERDRVVDEVKQAFYRNLIQLGVSPYAKNKVKQNALELAIANRNLNLTKVLLEHSKENANFRDLTVKKIFLDAIIAYQDIELIQFLIEVGIDVDLRFSDGETPLIKAIKIPRLGICKLLIENGADVNIQMYRGFTALMLAALEGRPDVCKLLIEKGADVNIQMDRGFTALMLATAKGRADICKLLIENRANLDIKDDDGDTALILAVCRGKKDICKLLIENRANLDIKDDDGDTALIWAVRLGEKDICKLLIENGATIDLFTLPLIYGDMLFRALCVVLSEAKSGLVSSIYSIFYRISEVSEKLFLLYGGQAVKEFLYNKLSYTTESSTEGAVLGGTSDLMSSVYPEHIKSSNDIESSNDINWEVSDEQQRIDWENIPEIYDLEPSDDIDLEVSDELQPEINLNYDESYDD